MMLIDDRIGSRELELSIRNSGVPCSLARLDYGDFSFSGHGPTGPVAIGIERKRLGDLFQSIETGRLSGNQLIGLHNSFDYPYLLVEGTYREGEGDTVEVPRPGGWRPFQDGSRFYRYSILEGYLCSVEQLTRVRIRRSVADYDTVSWLAVLYRWFQKPWSSHRSLHQFQQASPAGRVLLQRPSLFRRIASQLDGVGWERSSSAQQVFGGDIRAMLNADTADWQQVEGIGPVRAARIVKEIRTRDLPAQSSQPQDQNGQDQSGQDQSGQAPDQNQSTI